MDISTYLATANYANEALSQLSDKETKHKKEFGYDKYHGRFSKAAVSRLSGLSRAIVDKSMIEMEAQGYTFSKKQSGSVEQYDLTIEEVIDIYAHRNEPKLRETFSEAVVLFFANLKGGVSKSVTTSNVAHALRTHPMLLKQDLRILVIDLDPQASATVMLNHLYSIGSVECSSAQAMLQNVSREELLEDYIIESKVNNVFVMPASIEDGFIASDWEQLCEDHLPNQNSNMVLKQNVIDKIKSDFDFILIDSGPHLDAFLKNSLVASDILATPLPPMQLDLHSTLRYTGRLPHILADLIESGVTNIPQHHFAFMTKLSKSNQDTEALSIAKSVFRHEIIDTHIPNSLAFQRCAETFDTVISVNPKEYDGDIKSLNNAKSAIEEFALSVFQHIQYLRAV
uniref:AAA family ATPase n=1 Tax=Shewanella gaetbuli TaxID=220752 RepID=UPI003B592B39